MPTKRATVILIKVNSCNALLHMLPVCIRSYLISVLRYTILICDTYHTEALYLRERGYEGPVYIFRRRKGSARKVRLNIRYYLLMLHTRVAKSLTLAV